MINVYLTGKVCDKDSYPLYLLSNRFGYNNIVRHYDSNEKDRIEHAQIQKKLGTVQKLKSLAVIDDESIFLDMVKSKYES